MWGHGCRKLLLSAPFPLVSMLLPHPSCSLYLSLSTGLWSWHLCSPPGVPLSRTGNDPFRWSLAITGIFQGWPFALYSLMTFVWLQMFQSGEARPTHILPVRGRQSSQLKALPRLRQARRTYYGLSLSYNQISLLW